MIVAVLFTFPQLHWERATLDSAIWYCSYHNHESEQPLRMVCTIDKDVRLGPIFMGQLEYDRSFGHFQKSVASFCQPSDWIDMSPANDLVFRIFSFSYSLTTIPILYSNLFQFSCFIACCTLTSTNIAQEDNTHFAQRQRKHVSITKFSECVGEPSQYSDCKYKYYLTNTPYCLAQHMAMRTKCWDLSCFQLNHFDTRSKVVVYTVYRS